jgi:hypothetical protein
VDERERDYMKERKIVGKIGRDREREYVSVDVCTREREREKNDKSLCESACDIMSNLIVSAGNPY